MAHFAASCPARQRIDANMPSWKTHSIARGARRRDLDLRLGHRLAHHVGAALARRLVAQRRHREAAACERECAADRYEDSTDHARPPTRDFAGTVPSLERNGSIADIVRDG